MTSAFALYWVIAPKIYFCSGDWTLGCVSIFWNFPNTLVFLKIYYFVQQLQRQLLYKVSYNRYPVLFYFWWMETVLRLCKIPKYYEQDCTLKHRKWFQENTSHFFMRMFSTTSFFQINFTLVHAILYSRILFSMDICGAKISAIIN